MSSRGMKYVNISGELFEFIKKKFDKLYSEEKSSCKLFLEMLIDYFEDGENIFRHLFFEQDQTLLARLQEHKEKKGQEEYLKQIKTLEKLLCETIGKKQVSNKKQLKELKGILAYAENCEVYSNEAIEIYKEKAKEFIKAQKKEMRKLKDLAEYFK